MTEVHPLRRPRGFRSLIPSGAWAELVRHGVVTPHVAKGRLLRQGESGGWVMLSLSGRLKVVYSEPDGAEIVLAVRGAGDVIGELSAQDGLPRSATVQAIEAGVTCRLAEQAFRSLVRRLGLERQLDGYISGKLRESAPHAWQLAHRATAARLSALIVTIVAAAGPDDPSPTTIAMSQDELAGALGLVRSAITPVLRDWKADGLVHIGRGRLEVVDVLELTRAGVSSPGQNDRRTPGRVLHHRTCVDMEEHR